MKEKKLLSVVRDHVLIFALALLIAVVVWVMAMQALSPLYEKEFLEIPVEGKGCVVSVEKTSATFRATKEALYDYGDTGIVARVDLTGEDEPGGYNVPLSFYCGETEIFPIKEVTIKVTVIP